MKRFFTILAGSLLVAIVSHAATLAEHSLASRILNETDLVIDGKIGNTKDDSPSEGACKISSVKARS